MEISRRDVLRLSLAGGGGTALGGLIASGVNLAPVVARAQQLRIRDAKVTPSVCPFCAVGCATLVHTIDGQIVNIEGDPRSPHNEGTLCPKGAATFQLHINPNRPTQVLHRAPGATEWEVWDLNRAMDRVAELIKRTRDETFVERLQNGKVARSMEDSDCVVIMGSNMAENHPVAFRWPMKAKVDHGATLIHVDPRFTRTSAVCDIYAPIRAGRLAPAR